jgi:metallo-beta-lactamase family protein
LGSSSVELRVGDRKILFSGDVGNNDAPIIRDTEKPVAADVVVMETTYAMRKHEPSQTKESKLMQALEYTVQHRGVLLIPAFALERTEEVIWTLHNMADRHKLPEIKFFLDSPLAIRILEVFKSHPENYDEAAKKALREHHNFLSFPGLIKTLSKVESKEINTASAPKVIIAGSGMMEGGRIMYHLQKYVSLPNTTILVTGYQAEGTLGRKILSGEKRVRILGRDVPVHARVVQVDSFSAHADNDTLEKWIGSVSPAPKVAFLNHGEKLRTEQFAKVLEEKYKIRAVIPKPSETFSVTG